MSIIARRHDLRVPFADSTGAGGGRADRAPVPGVVHLVWGPLGPGPLRRFVASYREHPAGVEHELVILLNGVTDAQRPEMLAELDGLEHRLLSLPEPVQDLAAYAWAATNLEHERLCFLNSYSEILAADWLAKLDHALDQPGTGLVGATGSWASTRSWVLHSLFVPTPYRGVMPERRIAREQFLAIELERRGPPAAGSSEPPRRSLIEGLRVKLRTLPAMPEQLLGFEGFPAHHLRTNAFMADRATLARVRIKPVETKMDAYAFENGRHSLTRQVHAMGLRTLVVDRDGAFYDHEQWPQARTFWQGRQERLLVADNQTRSYTNGGVDRRRLLSAFAWGPRAEP